MQRVGVLCSADMFCVLWQCALCIITRGMDGLTSYTTRRVFKPWCVILMLPWASENFYCFEKIRTSIKINYFTWQATFLTLRRYVYMNNLGHSSVHHKRGIIMTVRKKSEVRRNNFLVFNDYAIKEIICGWKTVELCVTHCNKIQQSYCVRNFKHKQYGAKGQLGLRFKQLIIVACINL